MAIEEWPSISETILGLTLRERSSVAQVCRRSWKRVVEGRPAHLRSRAKERFLRLDGFMMPPTSLAKTRPPGRYREPFSSISFSWRERWAVRAAAEAAVRLTL